MEAYRRLFGILCGSFSFRIYLQIQTRPSFGRFTLYLFFLLLHMNDLKPELLDKISFIFDDEPKHMGHALGIEWMHLDYSLLQARMPVNHNTRQPMGLLHGGASVVLGETLASVGAWLHIDPDKQTAVGVEVNASHVRAVRQGWVVGKAMPLYIGRQNQVWEFVVETDAGKLVCKGRCTLAIVNKPLKANEE